MARCGVWFGLGLFSVLEFRAILRILFHLALPFSLVLGLALLFFWLRLSWTCQVRDCGNLEIRDRLSSHQCRVANPSNYSSGQQVADTLVRQVGDQGQPCGIGPSPITLSDVKGYARQDQPGNRRVAANVGWSSITRFGSKGENEIEGRNKYIGRSVGRSVGRRRGKKEGGNINKIINQPALFGGKSWVGRERGRGGKR